MLDADEGESEGEGQGYSDSTDIVRNGSPHIVGRRTVSLSGEVSDADYPEDSEDYAYDEDLDEDLGEVEEGEEDDIGWNSEGVEESKG